MPAFHFSLPSIGRGTRLYRFSPFSGALFILLLCFATTPGQKTDCQPFLPLPADSCAAIPYIQENITLAYQMIPIVHPVEVPSIQAQICRLKATLSLLQKDCTTRQELSALPPLELSQCQVPELERAISANPCLAAAVLDYFRQLPEPPAEYGSQNSPSPHLSVALRLRHVQSECIPLWLRQLKTVLSPLSQAGEPCPHSLQPPSNSLQSSPTVTVNTSSSPCFRLLTELVTGEILFREKHPDWTVRRDELRLLIQKTCFPVFTSPSNSP